MLKPWGLWDCLPHHLETKFCQCIMVSFKRWRENAPSSCSSSIYCELSSLRQSLVLHAGSDVVVSLSSMLLTFSFFLPFLLFSTLFTSLVVPVLDNVNKTFNWYNSNGCGLKKQHADRLVTISLDTWCCKQESVFRETGKSDFEIPMLHRWLKRGHVNITCGLWTDPNWLPIIFTCFLLWCNVNAPPI